MYRIFDAHYDEYGFQPIVVFDGEGRFMTTVLRPAKRPGGREACSNFATFSAGLCLSLAISNPPSAAKAMLQRSSLYREPAHWFASSWNSL
jgi:hypothetical protein